MRDCGCGCVCAPTCPDRTACARRAHYYDHVIAARQHCATRRGASAGRRTTTTDDEDEDEDDADERDVTPRRVLAADEVPDDDARCGDLGWRADADKDADER